MKKTKSSASSRRLSTLSTLELMLLFDRWVLDTSPPVRCSHCGGQSTILYGCSNASCGRCICKQCNRNRKTWCCSARCKLAARRFKRRAVRLRKWNEPIFHLKILGQYGVKGMINLSPAPISPCIRDLRKRQNKIIRLLVDLKLDVWLRGIKIEGIDLDVYFAAHPEEFNFLNKYFD